MEDFVIIDTLGKGAFGLVKLIQHKVTGKKYALKIIEIKFLLKVNH